VSYNILCPLLFFIRISASIMEGSSQDASTFCRRPDCGLRGTSAISIYDGGMRLCYSCPEHNDFIRWCDELGIDQTNPWCSCYKPSRRIRQQDRFYFHCAKKNCGFSSMYSRSYENCPWIRWCKGYGGKAE
jgi:hypothetical protein